MKNILLDFWNFIKKPKDERYLRKDRSYKWKVLFTLFVFNIAFSFLYMGIFTLIEKFYVLEHKLDELNLGPILMFLMVAILVPFFEEFFFRLGLRRKGIIAYIFSEATWKKSFSIIIYISTITFALIHITNYKFDSYFFLLLAPILTLSQFVSGFIMTYLRVKFNFWMGFVFHLLWNLSAVIITYDYPTNTTKNIEINNDRYTLKITKTPFYTIDNKTILYSLNHDTIYQLESSKFSTKEILKAIEVSENRYRILIEDFDIHFNSKKGILKDSLLYILEKEGYVEKQTPTN